MNINTNSPFYKLGSHIAASNIVKQPFSSIDSLEDQVFDEQHIESQKKYASILASIVEVFSDNKYNIPLAHLKKIAAEKKENWNDHCEEALAVCTQALMDNKITPTIFAKTAAAAELAMRGAMTPAAIGARLLGTGIPVMGALGGGISWLAEKELSEDDLGTELLKAKIKEHKRLSAEIESYLRQHYGYKTPEELQEEEASKEGAKALKNKEVTD